MRTRRKAIETLLSRFGHLSLAWRRVGFVCAALALVALVPVRLPLAEGGASYDISLTAGLGRYGEDIHSGAFGSAFVDPPGTPGANAFFSASPIDLESTKDFVLHVSGNSVLVPGEKVSAQSTAFGSRNGNLVFFLTPRNQPVHVTIPIHWTWSIHITADNPVNDWALAEVAVGAGDNTGIGVTSVLGGFFELVATDMAFDDAGSGTGLLDFTIPASYGGFFRLNFDPQIRGIAASQIPGAPTWVLISVGLALVGALSWREIKGER